MKVSVIVAAYNIEKYIKRCLESIINQTLKEIEIIVVNDGSTDTTLDIIKKISNIDERIIIVNQENKGLIEARKSGLEKSKGEYILFIDGDDWLELNALELLYDNAVNNKSDIVIFNAFFSYDDRRKEFNTIFTNDLDKVDNLKNLFLYKILPCIWSKFIKFEFIKFNNIEFPSDISFAEDLAIVSSLFIYNPKVSILNENLYNYYQRDNSITKTVNEKFLEINKAMEFIKRKLIEYNLYEKYKEEFEYLIFRHLFFNMVSSYSNSNIQKQMFKQYKNQNINCKNNRYITEYLYNNKLDNILFKLYNTNYYLGKLAFYPDRFIRRLNNIINK